MTHPAAAPAEDAALAWLALARAPGLGPVRAAALAAAFGGPVAAVTARGREAPALPGMAAARARAALAHVDLEAARAEVGRGQRVGARLLAFGGPGYPAAWDPAEGWPPVLWVRGVWPAVLHQRLPRALAVVGPRRASEAAARFAAAVADRAAWSGAWVVSGLAFGIDAAAHASAIAAARSGAPAGTVAVLASGVDRPTPTAHRSLARAILDGGGALAAVAAIGTPPPPGAFPVRNRWIAGLAGAVAVVEAGARSGALHTAAAALDLGREVRVAPARPWDLHAAGSLGLLRDGAVPLVDPDDGWRALPGLTGPPSPAAGASRPPGPWGGLLGPTARTLDELARAAGMDVATALAGLEVGVLEGWARPVPGRGYAAPSTSIDRPRACPNAP